MSIPKRPFFFQPEEYFDFGLAGEHPVQFICWIGDETPGYKIPVTIHRVLVNPTFKDPKDQVWDITEEIKKYPGRLERYEDEAREAFLSARERDWEAS